MKISDYKLLNNIDMIMQKPLMLLGVNNDLKQVLQKAQIVFSEIDNIRGGGIMLRL